MSYERPGGGAGKISAEVAARLVGVQERIRRAGGRDVVVVGVTKGFGPETVRAAMEAGIADLGENYAQELLTKVASAPGSPRWHFIGRLQRNKVRLVAPHVALWQSVDRAELGREIAARAPGAEVLVQVNVSGEPQKGGCTFEEAPAMVAALTDLGLAVRGLMGVGPEGPPERARLPFRRLVEIADELGLQIRSIGMTEDLEVAVEEGSTMVRVGRDLFGPRPS